MSKNEEKDLLENEEEQYQVLSQKQLMWRKFKQNQLAVLGGIIVLFFYTMAVFAGFIAPYPLDARFVNNIHTPPNRPRFIDEEGSFSFRPFVYGLKMERDMETLEKYYTLDKEEKHFIYFWGKGRQYKFWNLFETDLHLFTTKNEAPLFLLGTDKMGRDLFSRIIFGARVSLSVGLIGVTLSLFLGSILGAISGYYGGMVDHFIQRTIELMMSFPAIPMWMALAAAVPADWSPIKVYFGITVILSLLTWGGLARQIRGMVLSVREEEYTAAAKSVGASNLFIILKHILPNVMSHILVIATLSIPGMILGETALSFLGLGIRPPMTSWGVLLEEAQHVRVLTLHPWLVTPALAVIIVILGFNFLGDGIRDAADPYSN